MRVLAIEPGLNDLQGTIAFHKEMQHETPVSQGMHGATWLPTAMLIIAFAIVANDLRLSAAWTPEWKRMVPAALVVLVFAVLTHGNRTALGLCLPVQHARFWLKLSCVLAALMAVVGAGGIAALAIAEALAAARARAGGSGSA